MKSVEQSGAAKTVRAGKRPEESGDVPRSMVVSKRKRMCKEYGYDKGRVKGSRGVCMCQEERGVVKRVWRGQEERGDIPRY